MQNPEHKYLISMKKQDDIRQILERVILLSNSYSAAPYSLSTAPISETLYRITDGLLEGFTDIIFISLWEDYDEKDLEDYLSLSKECLYIDSAKEREGFLTSRLKEILQQGSLENWKELQSYFAMGLVLNSARQMNYVTRSLVIEGLALEVRIELKKMKINNQRQLHGIFL